MKLLGLSQLRFLRQAPWSTATVVVGIVLGVASVVAVHLISVRINDSLVTGTPAYLSELSFIAEQPQLTTADYFALRAAWRGGQHPEVTGLLPIVEGQLELADMAVTVVGVDAFSGLRSALPLAGLPEAGSIATQALLSRLGYPRLAVDEEVAINLPEPYGGFTVNAVIDNTEQRLLLTDLGTAQALLGLPDDYLSRVGLVVSHPWLQFETLANQLLPGLGAAFESFSWALAGWQIRSVDTELPSQMFGQSILFNLGALGTLALVVSWLLVYQVGLIWLRRRRRTMATLSFLGVSSAELKRGFLGSLALLAVLATGLGVVAGVYLAALLERVSTAGLDVTPAAVALDGWVLGKALVSGLGVSLLGGLLAFRAQWQTARRPRYWWLAIALVLAALIGTFASAALWGAFLAIASLCVLAIAVILPGLEYLAASVRRLPGLRLLSKIGSRELFAYPRDLAVAIAALMLAVATSIAMGLMVDSFRQDFTRMLDYRLADDVYIRSSGADLRGLGRELTQDPSVAALLPSGELSVRIAGRPVTLGYGRFDQLQAGRYGLATGLAVGQGLASERLLRMTSSAVGEHVRVNDVDIMIVGSFPGFGDVVPRLLVNNATASDVVGVDADSLRFDRLALRTAAADEVAAGLAERRPALEVLLAGPLRQRALEIFDQTFAITGALTLLALIVACIGLYNALLGLRLVQQPTVLLLASMGVNRAEIRQIALARGLTIGVTVLLFALPLGLVMGWLLCAEVNPRAFGWQVPLTVAPSALAVPALSGLLVILGTTLLPAPGERLMEAA